MLHGGCSAVAGGLPSARPLQHHDATAAATHYASPPAPTTVMCTQCGAAQWGTNARVARELTSSQPTAFRWRARNNVPTNPRNVITCKYGSRTTVHRCTHTRAAGVHTAGEIAEYIAAREPRHDGRASRWQISCWRSNFRHAVAPIVTKWRWQWRDGGRVCWRQGFTAMQRNLTQIRHDKTNAVRNMDRSPA